jgi:MFS superfamily sulfate permease-like transporter
MSKEKETQLKNPWKSIQTAIWLVGLAILAWKDWWWPGILVLIALSILTQAVIQILVPGSSLTRLPNQSPAIRMSKVQRSDPRRGGALDRPAIRRLSLLRG